MRDNLRGIGPLAQYLLKRSGPFRDFHRVRPLDRAYLEVGIDVYYHRVQRRPVEQYVTIGKMINLQDVPLLDTRAEHFPAHGALDRDSRALAFLSFPNGRDHGVCHGLPRLLCPVLAEAVRRFYNRVTLGMLATIHARARIGARFPEVPAAIRRVVCWPRFYTH